ncbi:L-aspartate oxidase [Falsibacillus pallidus]|uniref:L-aspartate oxidase n=1 Tax=Falsibacillus pallidus TaxID=493781 RepID=UPI003D961102
MKHADVIILGSGIAAMQLAKLLHSDYHVIIITKSLKNHCNSYMAQGGMAAAISPDDHYRLHYQDTLEAGRQHQDEKAVLKLVKDAPDIVCELMSIGVPLDRDSQGQIALGMEGAHSRRRIVHSGGDATGRRIMDAFFNSIPSNIEFIENEMAIQLILSQDGVCRGVQTKNSKGDVNEFFGEHVVLATGGAGGLYHFTSNHPSVTGDGLALAFLAGAELSNLEFVQFHPTLLYVDGMAKGLVSEAVRGHGAVLRNRQGKAIMENVHPMKDLAPRHIVAQRIYEERKNGDEVFLDITMIKDFKLHFPSITSLCEREGIDLEMGLIPVAPGSHFLMGGISINDIGETSIPRLYAIGEVADSGVHGANRLASNSLLEGLAYGKRLAAHLNEFTGKNAAPSWRFKEKSGGSAHPELPERSEIKRRMMEGAGIVRSKEGLEQLLTWLETFHIEEYLSRCYKNWDIEEISVAFMILSARLIVSSALMRTESRGGHLRADFPDENIDWLNCHIIHSNHGMHLRRNRYEPGKIKSYA